MYGSPPMILVPVPPHPTTSTLTSRSNNSSCSLWLSMFHVQSDSGCRGQSFDRDKLMDRQVWFEIRGGRSPPPHFGASVRALGAFLRGPLLHSSPPLIPKPQPPFFPQT